MNTLIQEKHNHTESSISVNFSRKTQKVQIHFAKEGPDLAIFSTDLVQIFGSINGNEFGVLLKNGRPHKPVAAYAILHIHSVLLYTDLIE